MSDEIAMNTGPTKEALSLAKDISAAPGNEMIPIATRYRLAALEIDRFTAELRTDLATALRNGNEHLANAQQFAAKCETLTTDLAAARAEAERAKAKQDRLFERASIVVHNLGALKTHYLQHVCLDNVRPEELASQIGYERDQLAAALRPGATEPHGEETKKL